jgi:hypothetical protein
MGKIIKKFLLKNAPKIFKLLKKNKILIEPLIAPAFMTLFSNLIDVDSSTKVLDRFMLMGESYIIDTICLVMLKNQQEMLKLTDEFAIQKMLGRTMYTQSLERGEFFLVNYD